MLNKFSAKPVLFATFVVGIMIMAGPLAHGSPMKGESATYSSPAQQVRDGVPIYKIKCNDPLTLYIRDGPSAEEMAAMMKDAREAMRGDYMKDGDYGDSMGMKNAAETESMETAEMETMESMNATETESMETAEMESMETMESMNATETELEVVMETAEMETMETMESMNATETELEVVMETAEMETMETMESMNATETESMESMEMPEDMNADKPMVDMGTPVCIKDATAEILMERGLSLTPMSTIKEQFMSMLEGDKMQKYDDAQAMNSTEPVSSQEPQNGNG